MSSDQLTEIRNLLDHANKARDDGASIGFLIRAVEMLVQEHEDHHHYFDRKQ